MEEGSRTNRSPTCIGKIIILIKKIKGTRMETWKNTSHPSKETWNRNIRVKHRDCSRIVQPQELRITHKQLKWNGRWDRIEDSQWKSSQKLPAGNSHPSASAENDGWLRAPIGMTKKNLWHVFEIKALLHVDANLLRRRPERSLSKLLTWAAWPTLPTSPTGAC